MKQNSIHWFRLGLRILDNEAFLKAAEVEGHFYPIFIVDHNRFVQPNETDMERNSAARHRFLQECLEDLNEQLKNLNSELIVLYGDPVHVIPDYCSQWNITRITTQKELGPYGKERDNAIQNYCFKHGIEFLHYWDQCLYQMDFPKTTPKTYSSFLKVIAAKGPPKKPLPFPAKIAAMDKSLLPKDYSFNTTDFVKNLNSKFKGGETAALERMREKLSDAKWVATFEKPSSNPVSLDPSTTVLSPYLAMGCISPRVVWFEIESKYNEYRRHTGKVVSQPPVSLHGQLYWREFFMMHAWKTPNFHLMKENPSCIQIDWDDNPAYLEAWENSRTGYPFIDAIMTQLRTEGWIHHLARHAVACFLTRGDLYQSWEKGAKIFEKYLLDGDYALNCANWQWLSCSNFFYQYFRVYSPIKFGQKSDKRGNYIRKWLPQLALFPDLYIYEPWKAPLMIQKKANCVIGQDYPFPIVDHSVVSVKNQARMKAAYEVKHLKRKFTEAE